MRERKLFKSLGSSILMAVVFIKKGGLKLVRCFT